MTVTLMQGDCLELMKQLPDKSVACVNTDRNFIGMELDEGFFKLAEERINGKV